MMSTSSGHGVAASGDKRGSALVAALDGFDVTPFRNEWNSAKQDGDFAKYVEPDFTDYLEKVFRLRASGGGVLIFLGVCSSLGSLGFYLSGDSHERRIAGVVFDIVGTIFVISGIVVVAKNKGRLRKLRAYRARRTDVDLGFSTQSDAFPALGPIHGSPFGFTF